MTPADHLVPARIQKLAAALSSEREGNGKGAPDHLVASKRGKGAVGIMRERGLAVVQHRRPILPHEVGPDAVELGREHAGNQVGPIAEGDDLEIHSRSRRLRW